MVKQKHRQKDKDPYKELIHDNMKYKDYSILGQAIISDKWYRFKNRFRRKQKDEEK